MTLPLTDEAPPTKWFGLNKGAGNFATLLLVAIYFAIRRRGPVGGLLVCYFAASAGLRFDVGTSTWR